MKRNLKKIIEEYDKKYADANGSRGQFYVSDMEQIYEMSKKENGVGYDSFELISNALKVGYMRGYRAAKK